MVIQPITGGSAPSARTGGRVVAPISQGKVPTYKPGQFVVQPQEKLKPKEKNILESTGSFLGQAVNDVKKMFGVLGTEIKKEITPGLQEYARYGQDLRKETFPRLKMAKDIVTGFTGENTAAGNKLGGQNFAGDPNAEFKPSNFGEHLGQEAQKFTKDTIALGMGPEGGILGAGERVLGRGAQVLATSKTAAKVADFTGNLTKKILRREAPVAEKAVTRGAETKVAEKVATKTEAKVAEKKILVPKELPPEGARSVVIDNQLQKTQSGKKIMQMASDAEKAGDNLRFSPVTAETKVPKGAFIGRGVDGNKVLVERVTPGSTKVPISASAGESVKPTPTKGATTPAEAKPVKLPKETPGFNTKTTGMDTYDRAMSEAPFDGRGNYKTMKDYYVAEKGMDARTSMMSPDEYLKRAYQMTDKKVSFEKWLEAAKSRKVINAYAKRMKAGVKFDMPVLDYVSNTQEGRTRSLAAKQLGIKEMPVVEVRKSATKPVGDAVKPVVVKEAPKAPKVSKAPEQDQLKSRVYERLQKEHPDILKENVLYERKKFDTEFPKAAEMVAKDPQKAYRVAMGVEDSGLSSAVVNSTLAEKALQDGNKNLYAQLTKKRSLQLTREGQDISFERGTVSENDLSDYVKRLIGDRLDKAGKLKLQGLNPLSKVTPKQKAMEVIDKEVAKAEAKVAQTSTMKIAEAQDLLERLVCK